MTLKLQLVTEICLVLRIKRSESKLCFLLLGRSPCLVVMEGFWFESWHCILDGHFSHLFVVKIVIFDWNDENKWKRSWGWPIFIKIMFLGSHLDYQISNLIPCNWLKNKHSLLEIGLLTNYLPFEISTLLYHR